MAQWRCPWLTVTLSNIAPALTHGYFIRHMNDPSNKLASGILEHSFSSDLVPLPSLPQPFLWPFPDLALPNHPLVIQFHTLLSLTTARVFEPTSPSVPLPGASGPSIPLPSHCLTPHHNSDEIQRNALSVPCLHP